jgi:hypothetical protein
MAEGVERTKHVNVELEWIRRKFLLQAVMKRRNKECHNDNEHFLSHAIVILSSIHDLVYMVSKKTIKHRRNVANVRMSTSLRSHATIDLVISRAVPLPTESKMSPDTCSDHLPIF